MRTKGHLTEGGRQQASGSPRVPYLKDVAERLFDVYVDTFKQAPESDFLLKRYFFTFYYEKKYLQDNVFFIPRTDFLWFFKYFVDDKRWERIIELKKRSSERAVTGIELATIHIRRHYTYEQGAADIIYTRTSEGREGEEFILKNTTETVAQLEKLLDDFRSDRVTEQPY